MPAPWAGLYVRNVLATVLPLTAVAIAIIAFQFFLSLASLKSAYRQTAGHEAGVYGQRIEDFFSERQSVLSGIAGTLGAPFDDKRATLDRMAQAELTLGSLFEGLYLNDLEGNVDGTHGESFTIRDRPFLADVKRGQSVFSGVVTSRATGHPVVIALVPIRDSAGAAVGALGGAIPLASLLKEIANGGGETSHLVLLDREDRVLAAPGLDSATQDILAKTIAGLEQNGSGPAAIEVALGSRMTNYLVVLQGLPRLGWRVALLQSVDDLEQNARRNATRGLLLCAVLILLTATLSLWTTSRILSPLRQLHASMHAFGRGDLAARAPVIGSGEIGEIAAAFNDMAGNLSGHAQELEATSALLQKQARELEIANVQYAEEREAAFAANRAKSEFLANMSHELRTPLNAILGFSELSMARPPVVSSEVAASYASEVNTAGKALLSHIDAILAYAQLDTRAYTPDIEPTAIADIVRTAVLAVEQRAAVKGFRVDVELAEFLPRVAVDPRAITRVLVHILSNAIKFTARGGSIQLRVLPATGSELAVQVRDTGVGIAPENLARVFEPFWQVEAAHTRSAEGLGLGLAYAKRLIEINDGHIALESEPGRGTVVTCYLPLAV